jgi:hypothetical protein
MLLSRIDFLRDFISTTKDESNKAKKLIRNIPRDSVSRMEDNRKPAHTTFVKILRVRRTCQIRWLKFR